MKTRLGDCPFQATKKNERRDGSVLQRMSPLVTSSGHSDLRIAATQPHFADHKSPVISQYRLVLSLGMAMRRRSRASSEPAKAQSPKAKTLRLHGIALPLLPARKPRSRGSPANCTRRRNNRPLLSMCSKS